LPFQRQYKPDWQIWSYNPQSAIRLLSSHGCSQGSDGIFVCDGRRLSLRFSSTSGFALRERTFDVVQQQLRRIGIELVKDYSPDFTRTLLPQGGWDLALFAWLTSIDPQLPAPQTIWACNGELNFMRYCSRRVTRLLLKAATELSESRRTALLEQADALMARDLPTLPLYVRPFYLLYNSRIRNVTWDSVDVLWNVQDWWIARR
jgi:peptide/nickel transport system substrate-binding protein